MTSLKDTVMKHDKIYSFLYGKYYKNEDPKDSINEIIEISTDRLTWSIDGQNFYYRWGWPGPDANLYSYFNFGSGWAFDRDTLEDYVKNVEANK